MDTEQRAWLAGFFDGEGCLTAHSPRKIGLSYPRIQIVQKDMAVLVRIQQMLGYGSIIVRKGTGVHALVVKSACEIKHFIRLVYPYAIVKKDRLVLAFALACCIGDAGRKVSPERRARRAELAQRLLVRST